MVHAVLPTSGFPGDVEIGLVEPVPGRKTAFIHPAAPALYRTAELVLLKPLMFFDLAVTSNVVLFFTPLMVQVFAVFAAVHVFPEAVTTVITMADPPVLDGKVKVTLILNVVAVALIEEIATTEGAVGVVTFFAACTTPGDIEITSAHAVTNFAENFT